MLFAFMTSLALAADVDRVPQDFATIQQALDEGSADRILVDRGQWAGAVVRRAVTIEGLDGAVVTSGPRQRHARIGFVLEGGATGSEIHGFAFDCRTSTLDLGVYASSSRRNGSPDDIRISENQFLECVQGVTNVGTPTDACDASVDGGQLWTVQNNSFEGFSTRMDSGKPQGGIGVYLFNVSQNDVYGNTFSGRVADTPDFTTSGIMTAGCHDCVVAGNQFMVDGGKYYWTAVSNFGYYQPGAAPSRRVAIEENDATADSAPHRQVNFRSLDSHDTRVMGNQGAVDMDHRFCGDGRSNRRAEKLREQSPK